MNNPRADNDTPGAICRRLVRCAATATLATAECGQAGWPYASLVLVACGHDARPLLLLSDLADHSKNIVKDDRVSLLFDGTAGLPDPLTGARISVQGRAATIAAENDLSLLRQRYLRRHPSAQDYADFEDFGFYPIEPERVHLVAGFGRIHWLAAADVLFDTDAADALAAHEEDIVAHMNADHADALQLYARMIDPSAGRNWRMTGIDPEGADLRRDGGFLRLDFDNTVVDPATAKRALAGLAKRARRLDDAETGPKQD